MSSLATPQKIAPKMVVSPQPQQRQQLLMPMPTSRTPINARSAPMASPQINPYPIGATPTSVRGPYSVQSPASVRYQHQTPFPVVNQSQKGIFEKIVDYLINDGPSTRYGMICKECYGHNGKWMAYSFDSFPLTKTDYYFRNRQAWCHKKNMSIRHSNVHFVKHWIRRRNSDRLHPVYRFR